MSHDNVIAIGGAAESERWDRAAIVAVAALDATVARIVPEQPEVLAKLEATRDGLALAAFYAGCMGGVDLEAGVARLHATIDRLAASERAKRR